MLNGDIQLEEEILRNKRVNLFYWVSQDEVNKQSEISLISN